MFTGVHKSSNDKQKLMFYCSFGILMWELLMEKMPYYFFDKPWGMFLPFLIFMLWC